MELEFVESVGDALEPATTATVVAAVLVTVAGPTAFGAGAAGVPLTAAATGVTTADVAPASAAKLGAPDDAAAHMVFAASVVVCRFNAVRSAAGTPKKEEVAPVCAPKASAGALSSRAAGTDANVAAVSEVLAGLNMPSPDTNGAEGAAMGNSDVPIGTLVVATDDAVEGADTGENAGKPKVDDIDVVAALAADTSLSCTPGSAGTAGARLIEANEGNPKLVELIGAVAWLVLVTAGPMSEGADAVPDDGAGAAVTELGSDDTMDPKDPSDVVGKEVVPDCNGPLITGVSAPRSAFNDDDTVLLTGAAVEGADSGAVGAAVLVEGATVFWDAVMDVPPVVADSGSVMGAGVMGRLGSDRERDASDGAAPLGRLASEDKKDTLETSAVVAIEREGNAGSDVARDVGKAGNADDIDGKAAGREGTAEGAAAASPPAGGNELVLAASGCHDIPGKVGREAANVDVVEGGMGGEAGAGGANAAADAGTTTGGENLELRGLAPSAAA